MHQQQWLAVLEELGPDAMTTNAPGDYENEPDYQQHAYTFFDHLADRSVDRDARFATGPSLDGLGEFSVAHPAPPLGPEPQLQKSPPEAHSGAESTAPSGSGAFAGIARGIGSIADKVTPG